MSQDPVEVIGAVQPDGTLVLDEKLNLPAGRVHVTIQALPQPPADDPFWQRMQAIWDDQKARGHIARTKERIDAEIQAFRSEAEQEAQASERLHAQCQQAREQGPERAP